MEIAIFQVMDHLCAVILKLICLFVIIHHGNCTNPKVSIIIDKVDGMPDKTATNNLWHVAIFKQEDEAILFLCGGTILQNMLVITAMKCVEPVPVSRLRVVAGLTTVHSPTDVIANPHSVYTVVKKYYPGHSEETYNNSIMIMKLVENVTYSTPKLVVLPESHYISKNCFTLGWGYRFHHDHTEHMNKKCQKQSLLESIEYLKEHHQKESSTAHSILHFRNKLGLSSKFLFKATELFKLPNMESSLFPLRKLPSKNEFEQDHMCAADEYAQHKTVRVSMKHHFNCFCENDSQICLRGQDTLLLHNQVDIGSPVFCRVKKPKMEDQCVRYSQYALAGVVTDAHSDVVPLLKHNTMVSIMRATNITYYADFIISVLYRDFIKLQ